LADGYDDVSTPDLDKLQRLPPTNPLKRDASQAEPNAAQPSLQKERKALPSLIHLQTVSKTESAVAWGYGTATRVNPKPSKHRQGLSWS
jgi:hypothetical protein